MAVVDFQWPVEFCLKCWAFFLSSLLVFCTAHGKDSNESCFLPTIPPLFLIIFSVYFRAVEQKNMCKIAGLGSKDLTFLKQWRWEWAFFMIVFLDSFQLRLLPKTTSIYVYVYVWCVVVPTPLVIPLSPKSSGTLLPGLLMLPALHSQAAQRDRCPLLETFLLLRLLTASSTSSLSTGRL